MAYTIIKLPYLSRYRNMLLVFRRSVGEGVQTLEDDSRGNPPTLIVQL